jgi:hypothetical chaperone protein
MNAAIPAAIDFGTSNSALATLVDGSVRLARVEAQFDSMPTAVFIEAETGAARFGREAIAAYIDGVDGRLMRSIKSLLGSDLMDETTEVAPGRVVSYRDVVTLYLRRLLLQGQHAAAQAQEPITTAVLGRPVFFVDDDPRRDALAQQTLEQAARAAGLTEVSFEFEPIAAALDHESRVHTEQRVLVADIGGGTSDFSIVRIGPARRAKSDRRDDILANFGVHVAGTDFDRALNLALIQPQLGLGSPGARGLPVPNRVYFDLATWHLINTVYTPLRRSQLRRMQHDYAQPAMHARVMTVVERRLGHALADAAERAKIEVSEHGQARVDLGAVEARLEVSVQAAQRAEALREGIAAIVGAARETLRQAGLAANAIDALYFTGGSTALDALADAIAAEFPRATRVAGDRFSSVVRGLALAARRRYAT